MRVPIHWLKDYVEFHWSAGQLAERLTSAGLEVEGIHPVGTHLDRIEVVEVMERQPHPKADKLGLVKVRRADGSTPVIVCGAPNVSVGVRVPLAPLGAQLPGMEIKSAEIRGVRSDGMLCSARELGLEEDAAGLMILPDHFPLGSLLSAFEFRDTVIELGITPNRGDCLSLIGIAREVAALGGGHLKPVHRMEVPRLEQAAVPGLMAIHLADSAGCPRYTATAFDVKVEESPYWMQWRLKLAGIRPINNVVDVTNYVLLETGQPLHAFDQGRLAGHQLNIRRAKAGEKIKALDDKDYDLAVEDLVIADAEGPVAIAGVMGGALSAVHSDSTRIVLEAAQFDPMRVRMTARRLALHSESSHRFERGIDPVSVAGASERAGHLLVEVAQGRLLHHGRVDIWPHPYAPRSVEVRPAKVRQWLGLDLTEPEMVRHLESLGFSIASRAGSELVVGVPSWRNDVEREADVVEEIARIHGYDRIPTILPPLLADQAPVRRASGQGDWLGGRAHAFSRAAASLLNAQGYHEAVNLSFAQPGDEDWTGWGEPVAVANPLSPEQEHMRRSLLPALIRNVQTNLSRQNDRVRLFEIGRIYRESANDLPSHEEGRIALAATGPRWAQAWVADKNLLDFYDLKGTVDALLEQLGVAGAGWESTEHPLLHPGKSARIVLEGKVVGYAGELHPKLARAKDIATPLQLAELDLESLLARPLARPTVPTALPRFPAADRDLAFIVDRAVHAGTMLGAVQQLKLDLLESARIFDCYEGPPLPADRKSVGLRLRFRHADRSVTEEELVPLRLRCVEALQREFKAEFREA